MESRKNEYTLKSISNQVEQTWGKKIIALKIWTKPITQAQIIEKREEQKYPRFQLRKKTQLQIQDDD